MVTKAAVLCGGEGTRLRPLIDDGQKTMIPVGRSKRPLLEYIVRLLVYHMIPEITMLTGHGSGEVEKHFGDGSRFGASIVYSRDAKKSWGSAQALRSAFEKGKFGEFDDLVVYYGDILSAFNLRKMVGHHRRAKAAVTLVLTRDYKVPVGVAKVSRGRVVAFAEKPTLPLKTTVACLVISRETMPVLKSVTSAGGKDIMTDFVPSVIEHRMKVSPYYADEFWRDVGTIETYERLDDRVIEENLGFLG